MKAAWLLCACLLLTAGNAVAQGRGPAGGSGMGGQRGGSPTMQQSPGFANPNSRDTGRVAPPAPGASTPGTSSTMRGGLQLAPPGRWWDDRNFAMSLGLRKEQQQKMDSVFNAQKGAILDNYRNLQKQESKLEATTRESQLDEQRIFAAIDAVNQARSALEKSYAHLALKLRQEMDAEQIKNMEKLREKPPEE